LADEAAVSTFRFDNPPTLPLKPKLCISPGQRTSEVTATHVAKWVLRRFEEVRAWSCNHTPFSASIRAAWLNKFQSSYATPFTQVPKDVLRSLPTTLDEELIADLQFTFEAFLKCPAAEETCASRKQPALDLADDFAMA
jgi:hypothetical protein